MLRVNCRWRTMNSTSSGTMLAMQAACSIVMILYGSHASTYSTVSRETRRLAKLTDRVRTLLR